MNTLQRQRTSGYAGLTGLFLVVSAIAQGCGNDNPEPTTPVVTGGTSAGGTGAKGGSGGTGNEAGSDNPGGSDATGGTSPNTGGTASGAKGGTGSGAKGGTGSGAKGGTGSGAKGGTGSGATGGTANEGGDGNTGQGGDGPVDCSPQGEGKDRCYPCAPTDGENVEFLNHCNDASCSHFDNEARIEGFTTPLPPL